MGWSSCKKFQNLFILLPPIFHPNFFGPKWIRKAQDSKHNIKKCRILKEAQLEWWCHWSWRQMQSLLLISLKFLPREISEQEMKKRKPFDPNYTCVTLSSAVKDTVTCHVSPVTRICVSHCHSNCHARKNLVPLLLPVLLFLPSTLIFLHLIVMWPLQCPSGCHKVWHKRLISSG